MVTRRWLVLLGVLSCLAACRREGALDCDEPLEPASGCTYDAECELISGGCCGEVHVLAPAGKGKRAKAWLAKCAPSVTCNAECGAPREFVAHCVRGVCAAVERKAEVPSARVDAGRPGAGTRPEVANGGGGGGAAGDGSADAGVARADEGVGAGDGGAGETSRSARGDEGDGGSGGGAAGESAGGSGGKQAGDGAPAVGGARAGGSAEDAGKPTAAPVLEAGTSCEAPPPAPSCERDADCDVVQATTECCVDRAFPVRAGATVPVRSWIQRCLPKSSCAQQCELPDVQGGRCVKGTCAAVVTRERSPLEKRPWDVTTPRRGVVTAGKFEPSGKKPLPAALQKWLRAKVPAIEACFTKSLQGQPVGAPATRVITLSADAKGVTQNTSNGDPLDELAALCPQMTLEDAGRPPGVVGKARYDFSWTLTFRGEAAPAKRRR